MVNPYIGMIPHGSSATITCVQGFTLEGKSTVTCFEGEYDITASCKADYQSLSMPNAVINPATQVAHGTTVQVACTSGYTLVGNPRPTCLDGSFDKPLKCALDI